jgi:CelD/BcsL family acetyltransferase involved in cellulose biosynthesis
LSLRIEQHSKIPEDAELHRQWNSIALQTKQPQVFYTCEWALAMQSAYAASQTPLLLLGYEGDELVGVASLATDRAEKKISFLAGTTADYCDFLTLPGWRDQFIDAVLEEVAKRHPEKLILANFPSDSDAVGSIRRAAKTYGFYFFMRPAYACARVELGEGEYRENLKKTIARKQMLQRKLRALESAGEIEFAHLRSWAAMGSFLPNFADAHATRFQLAGRVSPLATVERRRFIEDLARRFSNSGTVTLSLLSVNGRPIAWNYGFQFCRSWFWYQPTFDSDWQNYSPGYCLLAKIILDACDDDKISMVDLGSGDEEYKDRFRNAARHTLYVTTTPSRLVHFQEIARYRTATALKQSPKIETAIRRVLGRKPLLPANYSLKDSASKAHQHVTD